jgi:hypothetical protein
MVAIQQVIDAVNARFGEEYTKSRTCSLVEMRRAVVRANGSLREPGQVDRSGN